MMRSTLLERLGELADLRRMFADAAAGNGRLLVIEGPSGIGKSHLLRAAREVAADERLDVLFAKAGELERDYAFGVALGLFEPRFAASVAPTRERMLRGRARLAAPLLCPADDDLRPAATSDQFALIHGLYWCVVNLSEDAPVALLVDDVQWADELSLRFLNYLAERLEDLPVVLVVTLRTGDPVAASEFVARLAAANVDHYLRPNELSRCAVGQLFVDSGITSSAEDEIIAASWRATRGNPFLVNELLSAMRMPGPDSPGTDPSRVLAFAPQTVRRRVVLRLSALGSDSVAFARACAVIGDDVPVQRAGRLAGLDPAAAVAAAERLVAAQILSGEDPVCFAHPMIRSAVYEEFDAGDRPRTHLRTAMLLHAEGAPPEVVSHHLLAGTPCDATWVAEVLHAGARAVARKGDPASAVRYLHRAVAMAEPGRGDAAMLIDLGLVEAASGETTSLDRFEAALSVVHEPAEQGRTLYALGQTLYRYGRQDEAAAIFRRGAEVFRTRDRDLALTFEGALMCSAYYVARNHDETVQRIEAIAVDIAPDGSVTTPERVVLAVLSLHRAMKMDPGAAGLALRALGDGALLREQTSESMAANLAILALACCGHAAEANAAADAVLADARERGDALAVAEASLTRAFVMQARGKVTDAAADAQTAIHGMEQGFHNLGPLPHAILAQCLLEQGDLEAAASALRAGEALLSPEEAPGPNAHHHLADGQLHLVRADYAAALEMFLAAGEAMVVYGRNPTLIPWRSMAGIASHRLGDTARAAALIGEEVALTRDAGLAAPLGAALRARSLIEDPERSLTTLRAALAVLQDADAPLEHARVLTDLGAALRRAGQRVACRDPLRQAFDLAHRCGATGLEQRALEELLASGARPRRRATSGPDALTPSERRVATLAAHGLSTREIADALFLTRNTIAWHLRHIFRKLDVQTRDELGHKLGLDDRAAARA